MAIGLGLMFGFVFARNFDSPYKSLSITEFWRRWHISLSTWLREYLYIPLGGNRKGKARTYINLMATMLLGGLWHGASWNYVIWGGIHGTSLAAERGLGEKHPYFRMPKLIRGGITFFVVLIGWVFFRAGDLGRAVGYLASMFGFGNHEASASLLPGLIYKPYYLLAFALAAVAVWFVPDTWEWTQNLSKRKVLVCTGVFTLSIVVLVTQEYNPFIYFIF